MKFLKPQCKYLGDLIGQSTERTVKAINYKSKLDNVAIFIDYDNIYWTLMNNYAHDPNNADPNKNLFVNFGRNMDKTTSEPFVFMLILKRLRPN